MSHKNNKDNTVIKYGLLNMIGQYPCSLGTCIMRSDLTLIKSSLVLRLYFSVICLKIILYHKFQNLLSMLTGEAIPQISNQHGAKV